MNKSKPNKLETFSIDVTVDGDNAMLLDWGNMETVNIPKEDWQHIKEHIDLWFGLDSSQTSNIKDATISDIDVNNMKISGGKVCKD